MCTKCPPDSPLITPIVSMKRSKQRNNREKGTWMHHCHRSSSSSSCRLTGRCRVLPPRPISSYYRPLAPTKPRSRRGEPRCRQTTPRPFNRFARQTAAWDRGRRADDTSGRPTSSNTASPLVSEADRCGACVTWPTLHLIAPFTDCGAHLFKSRMWRQMCNKGR